MHIVKNMAKKTVIVDYGVGNLFSISRALSFLGAENEITGEPNKVVEADRLILPGVGAFGSGMEGLRSRSLIDPIKDHAKSGRPLLAICLGMQMLMSKGEEFGVHDGLGIIPGNTVPMRSAGSRFEGVKIPHIGWSRLSKPEDHSGTGIDLWKGSIFEGLGEDPYAYFVHSNIVLPSDDACCIAETDYNGRFCSALRHKNIYGCQFHPERSGKVGLKILGRFISDTGIQ